MIPKLNEDLTDAVNMKYDPEETLRRVCHVRTILIASSQIVTDSVSLMMESDDDLTSSDAT